MKFAFNLKVTKDSWGGGNAFLKILIKILKKKNYIITFDLKETDIDVIFIIDPRYNNPYLSFTVGQAINYKLFKNNKTLIIHRINECNKKRYKSNLNIDKILKRANKYADHTIFVSEWLKNQSIWKNKNKFNSRVILNGSDEKIFNTNGRKKFNYKNKLKLVTHHWSDNWNKGFKYYKLLDNLISKKNWNSKIDFSYIGKVPKNIDFKNTKIIKPLNGYKLSNKLKFFDGYITGSKFEPGSNHQNEAALCGLPLFYINHSSMPEYCKNYGVAFSDHNFEIKLKKYYKKYFFYKEKLKKFKYNSKHVEQNYNQLIKDIKNNKIISRKFKFDLDYIYFFTEIVFYYLHKKIKNYLNIVL